MRIYYSQINIAFLLMLDVPIPMSFMGVGTDSRIIISRVLVIRSWVLLEQIPALKGQRQRQTTTGANGQLRVFKPHMHVTGLSLD